MTKEGYVPDNINYIFYRELENVLNFLNCACMNAEIGQTAFKDVIHELVVLNKQPKIQWWPQLSSAFMNCCYMTGVLILVSNYR